MSSSRVDDRLREEAQRYRLRFGCESCVHFAPESRGCSYGFPTTAHFQVDLGTVDSLEFCKTFELG